MSKRRTYGDPCAAAHALDLVGERWALLVVRELVLGPKRFTDLKAGIPGASPNVLAQRLRELEESGVVQRRKLPPPASTRVYELTEWGAELEAVLVQLGRWGSRSPARPQEACLGADSLVLAMRTTFDPAAAGDLDATYELRLGEQRFRVAVSGGHFAAACGEAPDADATVDAGVAALTAVIWGEREPAEAEAAGELELTGDRGAFERLIACFPALEAASAPQPLLPV